MQKGSKLFRTYFHRSFSVMVDASETKEQRHKMRLRRNNVVDLEISWFEIIFGVIQMSLKRITIYYLEYQPEKARITN